MKAAWALAAAMATVQADEAAPVDLRERGWHPGSLSAGAPGPPEADYAPAGAADARAGGTLLYFAPGGAPELAEPRSAEVPSPLEVLAAARRADPALAVVIGDPTGWDVPTWAAFQQVDAIGLMPGEPGSGRPFDAAAFPGARGAGLHAQDVYHALLEAGLRLPPSAGGGGDRVHVQLDGPFDAGEWWRGLREGRSFVSNGPLLIVRADGNWPGHVFRAEENTPLSIRVDAEVWSREAIEAIEVVRDGRVVRSFGPGSTKPPGPIARQVVLNFERSGWFLVRAVAAVPGTFRFGSTAPFYVEIGPEPRISRSACDFFREWVLERMRRIEDSVADADDRRAVLGPHEQALRFWEERQGQATDE